MWENENNFSQDITRGTYNGWTIVCDIPLQVALYMGFLEVYLLGCDWDFTKQSHFYDKIKNTCDGHFLEFSKLSYRICKKHYESKGSKIINLTPNSKLDVFDHSTIEEIL